MQESSREWSRTHVHRDSSQEELQGSPSAFSAEKFAWAPEVWALSLWVAPAILVFSQGA